MKPQDRLPDVGRTEGAEPEVYLLTREDTRWAFSRRDVMGAAAAAAVAAAKSAQAQACSEALSHTNYVCDLAFTRDSRTLVSLGNDRTMKYWRVPEGAIGPYDMARSPDWRRLKNASGRLCSLAK